MIYHLSFRRTLKGSVWVLGLFKLKWITWWSLWEKIMDTVNCCFVWLLWNVNVSQILHKQLNKFDWSKIQLVVWQNNQRYLKFCLLIFLFHLLVECFFLMDDLSFFFLLVFGCRRDLAFGFIKFPPSLQDHFTSLALTFIGGIFMVCPPISCLSGWWPLFQILDQLVSLPFFSCSTLFPNSVLPRGATSCSCWGSWNHNYFLPSNSG